LFGLTLALVSGVVGEAAAQPKRLSGTRHFMYLSDQRILTLEVTNSQSVILNYINLGQAYDLVEAPMLVLVDQAGGGYRGHVLLDEESTDPSARYKVGELLAPHKFQGFTVLGDYRMEMPVTSAYFKTGGRILELEPLLPSDFDRIARQIGAIDLSIEDGAFALGKAGFNRGYGTLHSAGTPEAASVEAFFPETELLPPIALAKPAPKVPPALSALPDPVVVQVKLMVSKSGGLYELKVGKSPNAALAEIAMETVRNSWRFLPAISKGQIANAEVTLNVVFER
jgi:TonB family protein